jgi:hypothetical protein
VRHVGDFGSFAELRVEHARVVNGASESLSQDKWLCGLIHLLVSHAVSAHWKLRRSVIVSWKGDGVSKRIWLIGILSVILGVLLGGIAVEMYHHTSQAHKRESFNQRMRCNNLGKKYAESQSSSFGLASNVYILDLVDYSESRNSCIAELTYVMSVPEQKNYSMVEIVDLTTQESLKIEPCSTDCGEAMNRGQSDFASFVSGDGKKK